MPTNKINGRPWNLWTFTGRLIVFALASTSIACLLLEFYRLCPMREFVLFIFLPALAGLAALSLVDLLRGNGALFRAVWIGLLAGLLGAVTYDLFRLPFVFATTWGLDSIVPALNLFKVFPAFGAMILGEVARQNDYTLAAQLTGWAYHFSNGMTFGVMFAAMLGDTTKARWEWGVVMAVGIELGMLLTPYPGVFGIAVTGTFVCVTLAAHVIFGAVMGLSVQRLSLRGKGPVTLAAA
ncbi:MAG TPA: DUF6789 family protein [Candidatus Angelobacter sp.]|nr:DUF6789 family protein [Candidatus Angelobacter sp.]